MLYHVFRDSSLGHLDSKLEQFAVQPWCAPQEIGSAHVANQIPDLPSALSEAGKERFRKRRDERERRIIGSLS